MTLNLPCFRFLFLAPILGAFGAFPGTSYASDDILELQDRIAIGFAMNYVEEGSISGIRTEFRLRQAIDFNGSCELVLSHEIHEPSVTTRGGSSRLASTDFRADERIDLSSVVLQTIIPEESGLTFSNSSGNRAIRITFPPTDETSIRRALNGFMLYTIAGMPEMASFRVFERGFESGAETVGAISSTAPHVIFLDPSSSSPTETIVSFRRLVRHCAE